MGIQRCDCIPPDGDDLTVPWIHECDHHKAQREALEKASGFLSEADLAAAIMSGEQEGRAYRGHCPKCGNFTLKQVHRDHGMIVKACNDCGALVMLKDA
jgi:ribosomal protein S27E